MNLVTIKKLTNHLKLPNEINYSHSADLTKKQYRIVGEFRIHPPLPVYSYIRRGKRRQAFPAFSIQNDFSI